MRQRQWTPVRSRALLFQTEKAAITAACQRLITDLSAVFMHTTSLSFYGEGGETLGEHGYSKDYRPDLKQIDPRPHRHRRYHSWRTRRGARRMHSLREQGQRAGRARELLMPVHDIAGVVDIVSPRARHPLAMTNSNLLPFSFPAVGRKAVTAAFDGGRLTSDGGVRWAKRVLVAVE